jgi:hypothetical protein
MPVKSQDRPGVHGGDPRASRSDLTIPVGCFDPDCEFRIIVDATNVVAEIRCVGLRAGSSSWDLVDPNRPY